MPYLPPPLAVTDAMMTAAQWNQVIVENFVSTPPGIASAKGDLFVASDADVATRLAVPTGSEAYQRGLVIDNSGNVAWDQLVFWRWAVTTGDYNSGAIRLLPLSSAQSFNVTLQADSSSLVCTIPESGHYEASVCLRVLFGVGGVVANQVTQLYVSVNGTDYQIARFTIPVTTGAFATVAVRGIKVLPNLIAGDLITFKIRNEMTARILAGYGYLRKIR